MTARPTRERRDRLPQAIARALADEMAADPARRPARRGRRRRRRRLQGDRRPHRTLRQPGARHADRRAGDRRHGHRRRAAGPPAGRRDHVRRLRRRCASTRSSTPLAKYRYTTGGQVQRAGHDPDGQRRRRRIRAAAFPTGRELVPQRARREIVAPGTVETCTDCCAAAIQDDDPVIVFEHKNLLALHGPARPPTRRRSRSASPTSCARAPTSRRRHAADAPPGGGGGGLPARRASRPRSSTRAPSPRSTSPRSSPH